MSSSSHKRSATNPARAGSGAETAPATADGEAPRCLVRAVVETMRQEPALEAVKVDPVNQTVSVATLGRANQEELERALAEHIRQAKNRRGGPGCGLLEGRSECPECPVPLRPEDRDRIQIEHGDGLTTISRVTCVTAPKFWRWHEMGWPKFMPRTVQFPEEDDHEHEWKRQMVAAGVCGLSGLGAVLAGEPTWSGWLFALSYLAGAWYTVHEVWERLRERVLDVHFLMLAVAAGSAAIGAYGEGATLLFLFALSGALEHFALGRTHREIRSLFKSTPKEATVLGADGSERRVPVERIARGQRLRIKPDEQIPVDAEIARGETAVDESNLTGEATPVTKSIGETVLAGTLNLWGTVEAVVTRPASESALQRIIKLIREAQHRKAPSQRFTDKFGTRYTYGILGLTAAMFFLWWLGGGVAPFLSTPESTSAFYRAMTLLVVSSPCALVLSIPSAVLAAIAWGARRGILFRGGAAVEKLADITMVAMDKTGTLTTGELRVETVESFPPGRETEVVTLAYAMERLSNHPLARAVTRHGKQQGLKPVEIEGFQSVTGKGLEGRIGGKLARLGRRTWLAEKSPVPALKEAAHVAAGFSEVWIAHGDLVGRLVLRDDIRPESRDVVAGLRAAGLRTVVLTGDRQAAADHLKSALEPDEVMAELKPEEKVEVLRKETERGGRVAMIGDGVNDAPSLAAAHVGVAMGARGSDAALEQAEIVLMHDRLENFLTAHRLSRRARRIIRQNLVVSLGTVVVLVIGALMSGLPLTLGVLGHEGSTVVVVMNSLRLLLGRDRG